MKASLGLVKRETLNLLDDLGGQGWWVPLVVGLAGLLATVG